MANFVESSVGIQNCVMIMMEICMAFEMMLILLCVTRFEGLKRIILTVILFASSFFMMAAFQNDHSYSIGKRMNRHVMLPDIPMVLIVCGHRTDALSDLEFSWRTQTGENAVFSMVCE